MVTKPHILVVDDDDLLQDLLEAMLSRAGYRVSVAGDGPGMREVLQREPVDLVLLDVRLGVDHGFDLAREVTDRYQTPIIFVTGDRDVSDKVTGLEIGARRLLFDGFVLHLDAHELHAPDGNVVDLTTMELHILAHLAQRARQALTRNDISVAVSGKTRDRRDRTIDVVVSKLRRKLEEASPAEIDPIQTVRGVGYKFVSEVRQS